MVKKKKKNVYIRWPIFIQYVKSFISYFRIEYQVLKKTWSVDNKQTYKSLVNKKSKKPKEKKQKKHYDLTENRSIESLFEELKIAGVIENISKKYLKDFMGEFNWLADDSRTDNHMM